MHRTQYFITIILNRVVSKARLMGWSGGNMPRGRTRQRFTKGVWGQACLQRHKPPSRTDSTRPPPAG